MNAGQHFDPPPAPIRAISTEDQWCPWHEGLASVLRCGSGCGLVPVTVTVTITRTASQRT